MRLAHEKDPEVLRQAALILERENERLIQKNLMLQRRLLAAQGADASTLQLKIAELEAELTRARERLFAPTTERRPRPETVTEKAPQRGHGPRPQPELTMVEEVLDLDEADKACPKCGGALEEMAGQFEEAEEIEVIERRFVMVKRKRKKYRCGCNSCVETAPLPPKLIPSGRYSVSFAIEVAVAKYLDHLPLERQVRIMEREGLIVDSQTLWDQIHALARVVQPAYEALPERAKKDGVVGADETRWRVMGDAKKTWQVWALCGPDAVYYRIDPSRGAAAGEALIGNFNGVVMADGYGVYPALAKPCGYTLVCCWSHARREYLDIEASFPQVAEMIDMLGELYAVEQLCPTGPPDEILPMRKRLRQERSREILDRIRVWALRERARTLPESGLAKAIDYMLNRWIELNRFVDDPRVPLDNNGTERALRGVVIGRKNHYGSRSRRGTEVAAILYSLVETAKLCDVEPKAYLRQAVLAGLRGERVLLPHELIADA